MNFFLGFITCFFCLFLIYKSSFFHFESISKRIVTASLLVKLLASIFCWFIYTYYYTDLQLNDIYKYYNDGIILRNLAIDSPSNFFNLIIGRQSTEHHFIHHITELKFWYKPNSNGIYNDNQSIILINFILSFVSNKSIVIQSIWFGFIGYLGSVLIFKTTSPYLPIKLKRIYFFILFYMPSTLIWTSGIFKETLIYFSIGSIIYFGKLLIDKKITLFRLGLFVFSFVLLMAVKPYFFLFFIASFIMYFIVRFFKTNKVRFVYIISISGFVLFFILWSKYHNPVVFNMKNKTYKEQILEYNKVNSKSYQNNVLGNDYNILEMLRFKQADYYYEAKQANAKSLIELNKLDGTLENLFLNLPISLVNCLFRPYPTDLFSTLSIPFFLENCGLLLLMIVMFHGFKKINKSFENDYYLIFYFVITTLIFIGLLVPLIGNIVRYRAPLMPFVYLIILMHIDVNKVIIQIKRISFYKNTKR